MKTREIATSGETTSKVIMILLIVITSLNLVVKAQAVRCGSDGLGFRCEDNGDCWEKVDMFER